MHPASGRSITPLPLPPECMEVMIFGGTFDPPHLAHLELACAARDAVLGTGAWLVLVPVARSPHKPIGPTASDQDRLAMLALAAQGRTRVTVWSDEIDRAAAQTPPSSSYTVDTLERARTILGPDLQMRLLIGSDQACSMHRWREPRRVIELAEPVVLLREPYTTAERLIEAMEATGFWTAVELQRWRARVSLLVMRASSTDVRAMLGGTANERALAERLLDAPVLSYIRERGLYGAPAV